jgi:predicted RNA binding protein with dsRBD fold (UPF0201 family)
MSVRVTVESAVKPTEDEAKVERALRNVFPSGRIERTAMYDSLRLVIHGDGLEFMSTLRNLIKQERIRSAARRILFGSTRGQRTCVYLNKQAAFVKRISFCEAEGESPLGPISVVIEATRPEDVVDYLTLIPDQRRR